MLEAAINGSSNIFSFHECDRRIVWLGVNDKFNQLIISTEEGRFDDLREEGQSHFLYTLTSSDHYDVKFVELLSDVREDDALTLVSTIELKNENHTRFFSFLTWYGDDLVAVAHSERDNIVKIDGKTGKINIFVVREIKQLIDKLKYVEALKEMKKHRIDMNMLVDYKPDVFLEHMGDLIHSAKDPDLINLLIAALNNSCSEWCDGPVISNKVNRITDLLANEVLSLPSDRRMQMFVVALSALLKSTPQRVQEALRLVRENTNELPIEKREIYSRKWLHHVGFFVKEAELFDAALSTYDLHLTAQVAEASNRDPKEYIPLLNELRKVEPECYRKYRIDMVREDWR
ncbi:unnamed protein product, partial [Strongylus vulgaris]